MAFVSFIGAGPGDPELLTLKAVRRLREAGLILYAGSLVPPEVFREHTHLPDEAIVNSAPLSLEETHACICQAIANGKHVARLHTGDPSIYGAIHEQIVRLEADSIDYEIIPGISTAMAAAAALKIEYTLPEGTQTLILTRHEGRTPVPATESLDRLAAHRASMVIFLSAHLATPIAAKLTKHYGPDFPVAVAYRVGWPDMQTHHTTVADLPALMQREQIKRQALIIVSPSLATEKSAARSILYGRHKKAAR
jgi:precorrin-4/cobalt-precorrin-4 C11-methyltransferase